MKSTDQAIDESRAVLLRDAGELCVACGGGGAGMAKQHLNMAQA